MSAGSSPCPQERRHDVIRQGSEAVLGHGWIPRRHRSDGKPLGLVVAARRYAKTAARAAADQLSDM